MSKNRIYFEVILKTSPVDELLSKLKLLSQLALLSGGELYVVTPKGHLPFAKLVVAESRITAKWVSLV